MDALLHPDRDILFLGISLLLTTVSNSNVTVTNSWQMMDFFLSTIKLKQTLLLVNYF